MPADPLEYYKPWLHYGSLRFYLPLTALRTFVSLIKRSDLGTEMQLLLVEWIIFSKAQPVCIRP